MSKKFEKISVEDFDAAKANHPNRLGRQATPLALAVSDMNVGDALRVECGAVLYADEQHPSSNCGARSTVIAAARRAGIKVRTFHAGGYLYIRREA